MDKYFTYQVKIRLRGFKYQSPLYKLKSLKIITNVTEIKYVNEYTGT